MKAFKANQSTGFYMRTTLALNGLTIRRTIKMILTSVCRLWRVSYSFFWSAYLSSERSTRMNQNKKRNQLKISDGSITLHRGQQNKLTALIYSFYLENKKFHKLLFVASTKTSCNIPNIRHDQQCHLDLAVAWFCFQIAFLHVPAVQ